MDVLSKKFVVRNLDVDADKWWQTEDRRYYRNAHHLLQELLEVSDEIKQKWPSSEKTLNGKSYPELLKLCQKRDLISDSVFIFSAMAIEGFVNFYGVLRLGEKVYEEFFERFSHDKKIKSLLLVCDSIAVERNHPLIQVSFKLAKKRNDLVHPKTKEFEELLSIEKRLGSKIPESAQESVKDMESFFNEFLILVPEAKHLLPNQAI